ncbi:hypothetical protein CCMSSC00406_0006275 [Pleurotus cornucopiae]|uniref:Uncharacterized protein n=1 Tax=Pleurotus cornucopiae TaxID=5321 RepID=A0ACB7J423_PLECO|nr:hypothetical protein CCMSSC00406_0006275 [Pleurotus cornucopiae]
MFQEPWYGQIGLDKSDCSPDGAQILGTTSCPAWELFYPAGVGHPKAVTYIRKDTPHLSAMIRADMIKHPNIVPLEVKYGSESFMLINVYNSGPGAKADAVRALTLTELHPLIPTAVCGDFNLYHDHWSLHDSPNNQAAEDLLDWALDNFLDLQNEKGVRTRMGTGNQHDSTIDLTFFNSAATLRLRFQLFAVDESLSYGSDHAAITWSVDLSAQAEPTECFEPSYRINVDNQDKWVKAFEPLVADLPPPIPFTSTADLDEAAVTLMNAFTRATTMTMPVRQPFSPRAARWWNQECSDAADDMRAAPPEERSTLVNRFHSKIRKAKASWANNIIEQATPDNVWNIANWSAGKRASRIPPIKYNNQTAATSAEQGQAFCSVFYPSDPPAVDVSQNSDPDPLPARAFHPFTSEELQNALRNTSNTSAPGPSNINYRLIKWAMPMISNHLINIYTSALSLGHQPRAWRTAIIAIVPKPRKLDMSNPCAYRPIALLECLSKLLEKMLTTRILFDVGKYNLLPTNQFGGRDKSSTLDAGLTLVHDIQTAWQRGLVASALAFDIKGFFDHVDHGRLVEVLRLAGFSEQVQTWVKSFLSDRTVQIRVNGTTCAPTPSSVGVPQGSPLSPILAALYTGPILQTLDGHSGQHLYFYVDDGLIAAFSRSLDQNVTTLQDAFALIKPRLGAIGLATDDDKFDLMHFTRARKPDLPPVRIPSQGGPGITVFPKSTMRWLGFFFDRKLTFKEHVKIMCNRALSKLQALRILGNSVRGMNHANRRLVYKTVVLPVLTYGTALWYTGKRQKQLTNQMSCVQNVGLRLILGTFKSTPVDAMHHLGAILPIPALLERTLDSAAIRLRTLPRHSQPLLRLPDSWDPLPADLPVAPPNVIKNLSNLHLLAARTDVADSFDERTDPYAQAPWEPDNKWGNRLRISSYAPHDKPARRQYIRNLQALEATSRTDPTSILIFTDGSRLAIENITRTGAAFVMYHQGLEILSRRLGLGTKTDNFDGEMYALANAARHLHNITEKFPTVSAIRLFADNTSAIDSINDPNPHPAQSASIIFRKHVNTLLTTHPQLTISINWSPGHAGIKGNERADSLAKSATTLPSVISSSLSWAKANSKIQAIARWTNDWKANRKRNQAALATTRPPSTRLRKFQREFNGSRALYSRTMQAATGHAFTGEYYSRFNVSSENTECSCGRADPQTREHILISCPLYKHARGALQAVSSDLSLDFLFGTDKGLSAVADFLHRCSAFRKSPSDPG